MEVQLPRRGTLGDRPWGVTLGSLAQLRLTAQLVVVAEDGKRLSVTVVEGALAGATSPLASDSAARVALTSHLVSSSHVAALARATQLAPERDEVEVIAEAARLTPAQAGQLRQRLLVQRAARTFAIDRGSYEVSELTAPSAPPVAELYPAIFLGVRMSLSAERLADDLRELGARFVLTAESVDGRRFGFPDEAQPVLAALRGGTTLPDLEAKHRDIEPRLVQSVIYALVAAGACEGHGGARDPSVARARTRSRDAAAAQVARGEGSGSGAAAQAGERGDVTAAAVRASRTASSDLRADATRARAAAERAAPEPARARTITAEAVRVAPAPRPLHIDPPRPRRPTGSAAGPGTAPRLASAFAVREVIAAGIARLDVRADHFALLGVPRDATLDAIRSAYVAIACHLHPDKLPALDPAATRDAQRLFAHVNLAFAVLSDPVRCADYLASLERPAVAPSTGAAAEPRASAPDDRAQAAADLAQRGLSALRRDDPMAALELLTRASELAPAHVDVTAMLAWARFCAATEKVAIAPEVRRALERAIFKSPRPALARFYLGRVERMLGRVREALHHFYEVIELEPGHAEAAAEIRLLESRVARR
jgi:DnaJ-domain-containing protein 1